MQPDGTLNDDALDRELERALAVDPSPEFVARVRTRIANEPARSPWRASWMFAVSAAAAVVVTAVVLRVSNRGVVPTANAPVLLARALAPAMGVLPTADSHVPPSHDSHVPSYGVSAFARTTSGPAEAGHYVRFDSDAEVLIDPRESMALRGLINGVRGGRVDLGPVLSASVPAAMDLPPIDDIVISPIEIEPLAPPTGAEGVRQ
jgi:hypothetical protein